MDIKRYLRKLAELGIVLTAVTTLIVAGCGWVDGTANVAAGGGAGAGGTIAGVAVLGHVHGGTATAYAVKSDGSHGSSLGSGPTGLDGKFTISLSSTPAGPVAIEITGGSYVSETDGTTVAVTKPFAALLPTLTGVSSVAITPLSDMAHAYAVVHAAAGIDIGTAISSANEFIKSTFHLGAPPTEITPDFSSTALTGGASGVGTDGGKIALAIAALDAEATRLTSGVPGLSRSDAYSAFSADMSWGTPGVPLPGVSAVSITSSTGVIVPLPVTTLGNDLATALATVSPTLFVGATASEVTATATDIGATVTATIPKSVLSATGVSSSSSGAMSYTSIAGHQYLFIAARSKGVRKVDVTDPASAVEVTATSSTPWNGGTLANHAGFSGSIGGATVVSGSTGVLVLAFDYNSPHIALLDPGTGTITYEGDLTLHGSSQQFSGGNAYIAGAIPDPGKGVWLATTDGYIYLDINATLAASTGAAPVIGTTIFPAGNVYCCSGGSPNQLSENLGGDIANNLLFTPNYGGLSLQIVANQSGGLSSGTYLLDPSYVKANSVSSSLSGLSGNMDGGAVDTNLGVGIITYEDRCDVSFINLNGITASAVPAGTTVGTFQPPATNGFVDIMVDLQDYIPNKPNICFSGSSVDSKTDQIFGMAGYSSQIFVGKLQDPRSASAGSWNGMSDWVHYTLSNYSPAQDPHANVTVYNVKNSRTYAYILDGPSSPTGVVQIDVTGLLNMTRVGISGDTQHQVVGNPETTGGPISEIPLK